MIEILSLIVALAMLPIGFFSIPERTRSKLFLTIFSGGRYNNDTHFLDDLLVAESQTVSPVADVYELRDIWNIDASHYGEFNIPVQTLEDWWRAYPDGLIVIRDAQGKIQGGMGFWPVPNNWIETVTENCSPEDTLSSSLIKSALQGGKTHSWYISGIVIDKPEANYFAKRHIATVITLGFTKISERNPRQSTIIYSMPVSEAGARLLRRFDFKQSVEVTCDPPLYYRPYDHGIIRSLVAASQRS